MSTVKDLLETGGLTAISAALRAGEVSARELATHCLEAVAASDINAFIDVQPERTLAQADEADARVLVLQARPVRDAPVAHAHAYGCAHRPLRLFANFYQPRPVQPAADGF